MAASTRRARLRKPDVGVIVMIDSWSAILACVRGRVDYLAGNGRAALDWAIVGA
jgi:hypothetical protein